MKRSALPLVRGGVGSGSLVPDRLLGEQVAEGEAFVSRAVVGHDPLDGERHGERTIRPRGGCSVAGAIGR